MQDHAAAVRAALGLACVVVSIWLFTAVGFALYRGTSFGRTVERIPICGHGNGAPGDPRCYDAGELRPLFSVAPVESVVALFAGWFLAGVAAGRARRRWLTVALPPVWFLVWAALFLTG